MEANVTVAVRVKPIAPDELASGCESCVRALPGGRALALRAPFHDERTFSFDHCFWSAAAPRDGPPDDGVALAGQARVFESLPLFKATTSHSRSLCLLVKAS